MTQDYIPEKMHPASRLLDHGEEPRSMSFEHVLPLIKGGARARRSGWNGPDQWIRAKFPTRDGWMTEPYIYIRNQQGGLVPWLASQGDIFASDWEIV